MSLDKWLKPNEEKGESEKKDKKDKEKTEKTQETAIKQKNLKSKTVVSKPKKNIKEIEKPKKHLSIKKYELKCSKSKCGYQKRLMKKALNDKDKICPRCESKMKVKEL